MRYEAKREGSPTKWFDIDIMPLLEPGKFSVVMSYGMYDPLGKEAILQSLVKIYEGDYMGAEKVLCEKIDNRLALGYVKVEPKPENEQ